MEASNMNNPARINRRNFLAQASLATAGLWLGGCATTSYRRARRISPNEKMRIGTEALLVGLLPVFAGKRIEWNAKSMTATNAPELAALIRKRYRRGFGLPAGIPHA